MTINLHLPSKAQALRPTITVIGVGGAGGNAVNNMISSSLEGVNFVAANTDAQALEHSLAERRIQLGVSITQGLGAGAVPDIGRAAAEEAAEDLEQAIEGSNMVFITAGMGGGTGTGAAPVIAKLAKERGILTVGVVTKPFQFEGHHRAKLAESGVNELQQYVDTLIVIPNQNLFRIINERTPFAEAFRLADDVLHSGVRGVTDLIVMPGLINLDFADIRTVMREMGKAMMGTGEGNGEKRAVEAAEAAIQNPLLDDFSMKGARGVLINITGGYDMTLFEVDEAANRIRAEVDPNANIIFGATFNTAMEGKMRVSVVATGIDAESMPQQQPKQPGVPVAAVAPQPETTRRPYAGAIGFGRTAETAASKVAPIFGARTEQPVASLELRQEEAQPRGIPAEARMQQPAPVMQMQPPAVSETGLFRPTAVKSEPSFVSPVPEQPSQRSYHAGHVDTLKPQTQQAPQHAPAETAPASEAPRESKGIGIFSKMSRMREAFTSTSSAAPAPEAPRVIRSQEKPKMEVVRSETPPAAKEKPASLLDDEYLDIPAFLRRQAN
jgi:cell division protein FtsZ